MSTTVAPTSLEVAQRERHPANEVSALLAQARRAPELAHLSNTQLSKMVNNFVTTKRQDAEKLVRLRDNPRELVDWVLTYADPTGDKASHKADKRRSAA